MDLKARLAALHERTAASAARPLALTERLAYLGRKPPPTALAPGPALAHYLGGTAIASGLIRIERKLPLSQLHGTVRLGRFNTAPLQLLAGAVPPRAGLVFLDTETTGLAGGTGTLAFLVGLAWIEEDALCVYQWLVTGFAAEPLLLDHIGERLRLASGVVSFNGKRFDVPLLAARYRLARRPDPLGHLPHLDLLYPLRTAFASHWPDCRLQTAERRLLGLARRDDLPGWLVPRVWTQFVREGQAEQLPAVLEHNHLDLVSLVGLGAVLAETYAEPGPIDADRHAIAVSLVRNGRDLEASRQLSADPRVLSGEAAMLAAHLHRQRGEWQQALTLWQGLAEQDHPEALENLAKHFEHRCRDFNKALAYTERLVAMAPQSSGYRQRRERLQRKLGRGRYTGDGHPSRL
ncbi:MAG: ribonuclease H-like domain-containing protein [Gammaproteobacteria bacterium]